jgi:hypothetical protein
MFIVQPHTRVSGFFLGHQAGTPALFSELYLRVGPDISVGKYYNFATFWATPHTHKGYRKPKVIRYKGTLFACCVDHVGISLFFVLFFSGENVSGQQPIETHWTTFFSIQVWHTNLRKWKIAILSDQN